MNKYLIKIKPLEPYFFGDENTIRFGDSNRYFVKSLPVPSATTVMGTLRYAVLSKAGVLKSDRNYSKEERDEIKKLIGESTFEPGDKTEYGVIKGVSPLFLMKENDIFIKLPLNHKAYKEVDEKKVFFENYTPLSVNTKVKTSFDEIKLPDKGEFDPKYIVSDDMYVNIDNGAIVKNDREKKFVLFDEFEKITCKRNSTENGFIKKIFSVLNKDFCFAVVADIDDCMDFKAYSTICYMGREKSAFMLNFSEGISLEDRIDESYITNTEDLFCYALGDIVTNAKPVYTDFAMVNTHNLRYLKTADNLKDMQLDKKLYSVISAGSIFYNSKDITPLGNDKFGLNKIITFGGKNK